MLFNSFEFLFGFLPICLAGYFLLGRLGTSRWANLWLALTSLIFYGYWRYESPAGGTPQRLYTYVALLCLSTAANYGAGYILQRRPRAWILGVSIFANLAVLAWFKYSRFGADAINHLFGTQWTLPSVILPLAISFYTFTQIAFLVDAFRGLIKELSFARYCLFVFFFPHLIAGPIVHHSDIMPQFAQPDARRWQPATIATALSWLSIGLAKKVCIADGIAPYANAAFANPGALTAIEAWAGALAYTFQLYFDFSGYSDMAIGLSLLFNVRLPDNFNAPYRAADIVDFWRRWHMTLSRFLRDYLYFPLGGNRLGKGRRYINLFVTMLLGGIWHGAGWQFVVWGAYHGLLLAGCHVWKEIGKPLPLALSRAVTFIAVVLGWVLFRATSLDHAGEMFGAMVRFAPFRFEGFASGLQLWHLLALVVLIVFVQRAPTTKQWVETHPPSTRNALAMAALFCVCLVLMRDVFMNLAKSEFIYFQF